MRIEELIQHVPAHLRHESGKVFYSGRSAFESPDLPIYLLSLNPGESPDDHPDRSIQRNIDNILSVYDADWSAYQDDPREGTDFGNNATSYLHAVPMPATGCPSDTHPDQCARLYTISQPS